MIFRRKVLCDIYTMTTLVTFHTVFKLNKIRHGTKQVVQRYNFEFPQKKVSTLTFIQKRCSLLHFFLQRNINCKKKRKFMINLHEIFSFQFFSVVSLNIVLLIIFSSGKIVTLRRQSFVAKSDLTVTRLHRVQQTRLNRCGILFSTSLSLRNECQALELYV